MISPRSDLSDFRVQVRFSRKYEQHNTYLIGIMAMASNLLGMASNLLVMASNLIAMVSNLILFFVQGKCLGKSTSR